MPRYAEALVAALLMLARRSYGFSPSQAVVLRGDHHMVFVPHPPASGITTRTSSTTPSLTNSKMTAYACYVPSSSLSSTRLSLSSQFYEPFRLRQRWRSFFVDGSIASSQEEENDEDSINNTRISVAEAEQLRQRAQQLKEEARALELELETSRSKQSSRKETDIRGWMNKLFFNGRPLTPTAVARILREERFSEEQLVLLLQDLYQRRNAASGITMSSMQQLQQQAGEGDKRVAGTGASSSASNRNSNVAIADVDTTSNNNASVPTAAAAAADDDAVIGMTNTGNNQTEAEHLHMYMETLLNATAILDDNPDPANRRWSGRLYSQLKSRINEWDRTAQLDFQRRIAANVQAAVKNNLTVTEYVRRSLGLLGPSADPNDTKLVSSVATTAAAAGGGTNTSSPPPSSSQEVVKQIALVPMWIPASLLPFVLGSKSRINVVDVRAVKERVLPKTRFFCTSSDSIPSAAIFRGNMRAVPNAASPTDDSEPRTFPATVFREVQDELDRAGLSDRLQLFLLPDPEWRPNKDAREARPKPVIVALPKAVEPDDSVLRQSLSTSIVKKASLVLGIAAAFAHSVSRYNLNPKFFDAIVHQQKLSVLSMCVPVFVGVLAIQALHETAHRIVAHKRGMRIGLPLLIPSVLAGTFGCITPLRSFPPNRSALLDFALCGPLSAMLLSILLMIVGCFKTVYASRASLALYPVVSVALLKSSFLSGSMLSFLLPKAMLLPLSQPIPIHRECMYEYHVSSFVLLAAIQFSVCFPSRVF